MSIARCFVSNEYLVEMDKPGKDQPTLSNIPLGSVHSVTGLSSEGIGPDQVQAVQCRGFDSGHKCGKHRGREGCCLDTHVGRVPLWLFFRTVGLQILAMLAGGDEAVGYRRDISCIGEGQGSRLATRGPTGSLKSLCVYIYICVYVYIYIYDPVALREGKSGKEFGGPI